MEKFNNDKFDLEDILAELDDEEEDEEKELDIMDLLSDLDDDEEQSITLGSSVSDFAASLIREAEEEISNEDDNLSSLGSMFKSDEEIDTDDMLSILDSLDEDVGSEENDEDDDLDGLVGLLQEDESNYEDEEESEESIEELFASFLESIKNLSDDEKNTLASNLDEIPSLLEVDETSDLQVAGLKISNTGVITETRHNYNIKKLIIKESYNGIKVTKVNGIFKGRFDNEPKLEEVVFEGNIAMESSFWDCPHLKKVTINGELLDIRGFSFERSKKMFYKEANCTYVKINDNDFYLLNRADSRPFSIEVMYGCKYIGLEAFQYSWNKEVVLSRTVERIFPSAFGECKDLLSITLNEGLKIIDDYAFENCTSLVSVYVPSTVEYLGHNVFDGCIKLKNVYISKNTKYEKDTFPSHVNINMR